MRKLTVLKHVRLVGTNHPLPVFIQAAETILELSMNPSPRHFKVHGRVMEKFELFFHRPSS